MRFSIYAPPGAEVVLVIACRIWFADEWQSLTYRLPGRSRRRFCR